MNKLFTEFENENALRSYPFASGCTTSDTNGHKIGTGVLIDAALYPVNSKGELYLSSITKSGHVNISDDTGVVMTAPVKEGCSMLEFYDSSVLRRHVGTMIASSYDALSSLVNVYTDRKFKKSATLFASTCVFPIVNDGITSIDVGGTGAIDGEIVFENTADDAVRISTKGDTLRFDIIPPVEVARQSSIQHIYCIVDGKTPFRIEKLPFELDSSDPDAGAGNTIAVYLDNIDRQDICGNAHREHSLEMADTCKECASDSSCYDPPEPPIALPDTFQAEVVDIPHGCDSAFYLTVPNMFGYDNPLSLTLVDGVSIPNTNVTIEEGADNLSKLTDTIASKGVILQVPGLTPSV